MDPLTTTSVKALTKKEYLERLKNLLPASTIQGEKLVLTLESINHSCLMTEELIREILKALLPMPETDMVYELKESLRNMWALIRFLAMAFEVIQESIEDE